MSKVTQLDTVKSIVFNSKKPFNEINVSNGNLKFEQEQLFAIQALQNNDYLCGIAYKNKDSLKMAVLNVAGVGLSLNPVRKQAYLVPREGRVCLDVSYLGMIQIALDVGAIRWAKAEIVRENDVFKYTGFDSPPTHEFDPFSDDRGEIVGCYCTVRLLDGEYLTTPMKIADIFDIRNRSKAWISYKNPNSKAKTCPWVTDEEEMIKKTVIRRAYKSWPLTNSNRGRFDTALEVTNEDHEIVDIPVENKTEEEVQDNTKILGVIRAMMTELDKSEEYACDFASRIFTRKIEKLEDLTSDEVEKFYALVEETYNKIKENEKDEDTEGNTKTVEQIPEEPPISDS